MLTLHRRTTAFAATLVVGTAGLVGLVGATAGVPAQAEAPGVPGCVARDLAVSLGRLDAGLGSRYQDIRIANVSGHDCRLTGYPRYRFESSGRAIGFSSQRQGSPVKPVRLEVGDSAWTTLWWTDPGPVPSADCHDAEATSLRLRLPHRPHVYRLAVDSPVCTTRDYRPVAYPLRDRAVF